MGQKGTKGILGFVQARSIPSLISGVVFGIALLFSGWFAWQGSALAVYVAGALVLLLALFFAYRFTETGKLMPGGLMFALSFLCIVVLVIGVFTSIRR